MEDILPNNGDDDKATKPTNPFKWITQKLLDMIYIKLHGEIG